MDLVSNTNIVQLQYIATEVTVAIKWPTLPLQYIANIVRLQ
jgi:hypothetical protein